MGLSQGRRQVSSSPLSIWNKLILAHNLICEPLGAKRISEFRILFSMMERQQGSDTATRKSKSILFLLWNVSIFTLNYVILQQLKMINSFVSVQATFCCPARFGAKLGGRVRSPARLRFWNCRLRPWPCMNARTETASLAYVSSKQGRWPNSLSINSRSGFLGSCHFCETWTSVSHVQFLYSLLVGSVKNNLDGIWAKQAVKRLAICSVNDMPCIPLDELPRLLPEDDPEMLASLIKSESSDRVQRVSEPGRP